MTTQSSRGERWLELAGVDDVEIADRKFRSIRRLVLITIACEGWFALGYLPYSHHPDVYGSVAIVWLGTAIAGWRDRWAVPACLLAGALLFGVYVSVFPENANHQVLALLLLTFLVLGNSQAADSARDIRVALQGMRWIAAIGLFWAGVMKLYYGYWLGGEFLAFRVATDPGFARVLGPLVPVDELSRLLDLGTAVGAGPFRADAPLLIVVSNLTWAAELALPFGLMWRPTRAFSMVAAILLFVAIQLGAREIFFGGLMVGLLLLFDRRDRISPFLPWLTGIYVLWLLRNDIARWIGAGA